MLTRSTLKMKSRGLRSRLVNSNMHVKVEVCVASFVASYLHTE
jgi:hypothetical protein